MRWGWPRVGALLAPLCLASCGVTEPCLLSDRVEVRFADSLAEYGDLYGITFPNCDRATEVWVLRTAPPAIFDRLIAHELLHAAGLVEHEPDPSCYLYPDILGVALTTPCPQEVSRLLAVTGSFSVHVMDLELLPHAHFAAELWNQSAGREVFVVFGGP
jgi:hypothetical protein